jgi:hypothetical protein
MRWIHATLSMRFGDEESEDVLNARFSGAHMAATSGDFLDGMAIEPPASATFQVYSVEIQLDGEHWTAFPRELYSKRLDEQLQRVGVEWARDENERAAEFQAECRREERAALRLPTPANTDAALSEKVA